eukprot:TRINITY_DN2821_c0_g2_i2.p1 TRINITY_DN2821_c0_g2~~TRINITY_DN2821_c0_g2_i2.p1  ORF type:complete len:293 (+),score=133.98 TRINITY_DN2821_c0_g2_i2:50-928(+)
MAAAVPTLPSVLHYIPGHHPRPVTIDDFELGKQVGQGRYGTVFVARDRRTNGMVALKRLCIATIVEERMEHQVMRELEIMKTLQHPNILRLFTYFVDKEYINLVIEYAARGDVWNRLLADGKFSLEMTAKLVAQLTEAIAYAHKNFVIHRDIKPENLLLDINKNLKLADFGWSVLDKVPQRKTYCGTPDYIPPEMAANKSYDFKVDNWCIGVFAYECLFGKPPFEAEDDVVRTRKILNQEYAFPTEPCLPDEAYDLVRNLLKHNPKERMTCDEILSHPFIVKYHGAPKAAHP